MIPGDVVTDMFNNKWIIYDFHNTNFLCVTDFETQSKNEVIPRIGTIKEDLKIDWLFIKRREKNLTGLEKYL